jgi:hypothetical protein
MISYFEKVCFDKSLSKPQSTIQDVISVLACAVISHHLKYVTFNAGPDDGAFFCQMSTKKSSCMEKDEAIHTGLRMYQEKVK